MEKLTPEEIDAIKQALISDAFKNLIGAEEWDLSEADENLLWDAIKKIEGRVA